MKKFLEFLGRNWLWMSLLIFVIIFALTGHYNKFFQSSEPEIGVEYEKIQ